MRKWQDQAAPDDPGAWNDVAGVWPTPAGTYESMSALTTLGATTTAGQPIYAFKGQGVSRVAEYVVTTTKIFDASLTDRTGGVTVGSFPFMVQYGDITICAMGNANATVTSNGGAFAALAGAPKAEFFVVQRNSVVAFNTDSASDGWAASDVGDYTNWTTGEAASGRIITTPGNITAAVPFGNDIIVFKPSAIYRMSYVGGLVKWAIDLLWSGVGCTVATGQTQNYSKYYARQGIDSILFFGQGDDPVYALGARTFTSYAYLFDGSNRPVCVNPFTSITEGMVLHDPSRDTFTVIPIIAATNIAYFYNRRSDAWGTSGTSNLVNKALTSTHAPIPIVGEYFIRQTKSPMPNFWGDSGGNLVKYTTSSSTLDAFFSVYLETKVMGVTKDGGDTQTQFGGLRVLYRRKGGGLTGAGAHVFPSLLIKTWQERYQPFNVGGIVTPVTSKTVAQSATTGRDRFNFALAESYATFKVTWASAYDVEVDDFIVSMKPSGIA